MRIAVVGDDRRFSYLARILRNMGYDVTGEAHGAELAVCSWPAAEDVSGAKHIVCCGPKSAPDGMTDLLSDEQYMTDVAYMTAEGALVSAMNACSRTLKGARCLVVGWGRIGKALTALLHALGADVTALSRRREAFFEIESAGAHAGLTKDAAAYMPDAQLVFSTPPFMALDGDVLSHADPDVRIIDLASAPYGVDMDAAAEIGLHAWREPGLPGRYCPESAAMAVLNALERHGLLKGGCEHGMF